MGTQTEKKHMVSGAARLLQVALLAIMQGELDAALGYGRSQRREGENSRNFRNGYSARTLRTTFGPVPLAVPRDRSGVYSPRILARYCRETDGLEERLLLLFAQDAAGIPLSERVKALYGEAPEEETLRRICGHLLPAVRAWQMRRLAPVYPFIALETIHEQGENGRTGLLLLGELPGGGREVLSIRTAARPSLAFWLETLADLRARGVAEVPLFCVGGGTGFRQAARTLFPASQSRHVFVPALRVHTGQPDADTAQQAL